MAMIGPNSPQAPAPMKKVPKRVLSSPRSRSIGRRVPSAVDVSAIATPRVSWIFPVAVITMAAREATASETNQPMAASLPLWPRTARCSSSIPARKKSRPRPSSESSCDGVVDLDPADHLGAEHDACTQQEHHFGDLDAEQPDDQGDERGDRRDHDERPELLGHAGSSGGSTMRRLAVSSLGVPARAPSTACSSGLAARIVVM